jgi:hypothetical protein
MQPAEIKRSGTTWAETITKGVTFANVTATREFGKDCFINHYYFHQYQADRIINQREGLK